MLLREIYRRVEKTNLKSFTLLFGVCLAIIGAILYLVTMCSWMFLAYIAWRDSSPQFPVDWWQFRHAIAAPLLFGIFISAILKRKKTRLFIFLLASAFVIMICWSLYDCYHRNYQVGTHSLEYGWDNYHVLGKGARHYYFNWPWLMELEPWLPHRKTRPNKSDAGNAQ
jgi:uncharacterized membrane protein YbaN (DUF454 family)